jgi:SAM-dependent methyltransferase
VDESVAFSFGLCAAYVFVVFSGIFATVYLFRIYRTESGKGENVTGHRWTEAWEFFPNELGGFSYGKLAVVSVLALFLELLAIRWVSSEIRVFAYFKNFVLIACFLGFGLGCYLSGRRVKLLSILIPLLTLTAIVQLPWGSLHLLISDLPALAGGASDTQIWEVPTLPNGWFLLMVFAAALVIIVPIFCLLTFVFIPFGQLVGWYFEKADRLVFGYTVNVLGSLVGILLYTFLCFLGMPPAIWFLLAGGMLTLMLWQVKRLRWAAAVAFVVFAALTLLGPGNGSSVYWSPYQKLTLIPQREAGQTVEYALNTNGTWYQRIVDLSPRFVASHPEFFKTEPVEWNPYNIPYHFYPQPPSVLVLGAGMGNDVAAALRNGASRVVAVEIDPLILKLGRQLHPEAPYSSPKVHVVVDDARSYVQSSQDRFDLIVFSLLDSHTTSSTYTNIRIDNYVYTLEALKAAKRLLEPEGVFIIKFQVETPWIAGRLRGLMENVFGRTPLQLHTERSPYGTQGTFYIAGSQERIAKAMLHPELAAFVTRHNDFPSEQATLTTDDWPYFYQREPGLPVPVMVISSVLVLLCWLFLRKTGTALRETRWHFFFLGAGFMLLEAQIISKMALLFGTTWVVNSIVIAGILLVIVGANYLVEYNRDFPVTLAYAGIFVTVLVSYFMPVEKCLHLSFVPKMLLATVVLCLPVFFAGVVFVRSFARESFPAGALGANLFGGLVGGLLESLSLWTGIRSLVIVAGLLYLASWIAMGAKQPVGQVALQAVHDD